MRRFTQPKTENPVSGKGKKRTVQKRTFIEEQTDQLAADEL
jgi:hypothetical protein